MKIIFFDVQPEEKGFINKNFNRDFEYYIDTNTLNNPNQLTDNYKTANVISVFTNSRLNTEILSQFKNLKMIALRSVGYNHVDIDYCKKHNIVVCNTPDYGNTTVAEFALGLLLDLARKISSSYLKCKSLNYCPKSKIGIEIFGKNAGIVGLGAIGMEFARIVHGLGANIYAYDLLKNEDAIKKYNVQYTDFETVLRESDFISIHTPLTKDNYHMFNQKSFEIMKKNCILINTGRGELIDIEALYDALINEKIAGAALDVLENEEVIFNTNCNTQLDDFDKDVLQRVIINYKMFKLENVIITPHSAYKTHEAIRKILDLTLDNINSFKNGKIINSIY